ncbi:methyltransferase domain-containing protein [Vibrio toranzoniae]|nr:methyltransferase domain-containing protein [Vibrio toranzoniae]
MMSKFSRDELQALHGKKYVTDFLLNQNKFRIERILPFIDVTSSSDVADFACGNAMLMPFIAPLVNHYVGVDFSSEFINAANEHKKQSGITNASFYCENINKFCERNQKQFDVTFAMDFSEHVYDDDWLEILVSIRESMKTGATMYLHTPNAGYLVERIKKLGIVQQLPEHIAVRDTTQNVRLLEVAGFKDIKVTYLAHYEKRQAWLHSLQHLPILGPLFQARLLITCKS